MKTITIILIALFTLQVTQIFAGNESASLSGTPVEITFNIATIMPVTPSEATFEEMTSNVFDFYSFAPVTPGEAVFEEMVPEPDFSRLAPVAPAEAEFSDSTDHIAEISILAPVTPRVADFE